MKSYQWQTLKLQFQDDGIAELVFDNQAESVNTLSRQTLQELQEALNTLQGIDGVKGLLLTSSKNSFIVGANISEFNAMFEQPEAEIVVGLLADHALFSTFEALPYPVVAAINGITLGGGFELGLAADCRVLDESAKVGLPEVNLGIFPGWGGTVRLPRLIGPEAAIQWIASGKPQAARKALEVGAVDALAPVDELRTQALALLQDCIEGRREYRSRRSQKHQPLPLSESKREALFAAAKEQVAAQVGPNYPAPLLAVEAMAAHAGLARDEAFKVEATYFAQIAKTDQRRSLVGLFLSDQQVKRAAKGAAKQARPVRKAAVLGAGIMGGGIAYQSAHTGTPILMKDINQPALDLGCSEADKLLSKQVSKGRLTEEKKARVLDQIQPTLSYNGFSTVDLVVEAVVENPKVKGTVLAEVEQQVGEHTILTSNTSTISISRLAQSLQRPENFCGMHFFNPVHMMPLVEVIRGEQSSEEAVATTVAYAQSLGKMPIVVNDCPGFLVNRILFPYFGGFDLLVRDGVDFQRIDQLMKRFGWPMGPAYLLDVVGIDTAVHADQVMAEGFPDRMGHAGQSAIEQMLAAEHLGQKNGRGFYRYTQDPKGRSQREADLEAYRLLEERVTEPREVDDDAVVHRMMIPLCLEAVRCLEDGIAGSAAEVDMGLVLGLGFPRFRGGALRYIDTLGVAEFCALVDHYAELGALYQVTDGLRRMAAEGRRFFA